MAKKLQQKICLVTMVTEGDRGKNCNCFDTIITESRLFNSEIRWDIFLKHILKYFIKCGRY